MPSSRLALTIPKMAEAASVAGDGRDCSSYAWPCQRTAVEGWYGCWYRPESRKKDHVKSVAYIIYPIPPLGTIPDFRR